jgi:putative ABC transport system permease protein
LAAIGVYGVLAYRVTQRNREIGIRLALGAEPRQVLSLVLREGGALVTMGIPLGIAGAVLLTRALAGMLFGLSTLDVPTYAVTALGFAAVAMLASYVPARRATRVDPLLALRQD